jgi:hypothetical protein
MNSVKHIWISILTGIIILMVQVTGVSHSGPSCGAEKPAGRCILGCCSGAVCECGMAPNQKPVEPAPVAPTPQIQPVKFMPVLVNVCAPMFTPVVLQKPSRPLTPDDFLPHGRPALVLHCALLI